jgi:hypothetical protein
MNVSESSYEGALLRLQRLGHDLAFEPPVSQPAFLDGDRRAELERMRELEELASLSCEENERLEHEVAELREENARLVARLTALSSVEPAFGDTELATVPRRRGGLLVAAAIAVVAIGAGVFALVPRHSTPPVAPVVVAVAPAPAPPPPVVAPEVHVPVVPQAVVTPPSAPAPTIPPVAIAAAPSRHHAKDHASAKHKPAKHIAHSTTKSHVARAKTNRKLSAAGNNDPLAGLSL